MDNFVSQRFLQHINVKGILTINNLGYASLFHLYLQSRALSQTLNNTVLPLHTQLIKQDATKSQKNRVVFDLILDCILHTFCKAFQDGILQLKHKILIRCCKHVTKLYTKYKMYITCHKIILDRYLQNSLAAAPTPFAWQTIV